MKSFFRPLMVAVAAVLLCGLVPDAAATHFRFANLSWKRAPGTNPLAVEITVTEAWQKFSKGTVPYDFGDGTGSFDSSTATRIASLMDQAGEEYEVWRYSTTHTYPSNGLFTVFGTSCCRISSLVNAGDGSESFTMGVDLRSSLNTGSPVTTAPVILQMQAGANNSIALPIVDPDGDAFTVRLATSAESSIFTLPTVGGNAISVTAGGVLNWNTVGGTSGQKFALQVVIEENRAGNTTGINGRVPLDFIIELAGSLTNLPPTVTGTNGSITLAANQTFTTTFVGTDPEAGPLRVNHQGLPPGATLTPADGTTNASPASVTFSWTPAPSDVGSSYAVLIFFTDQGGLQRAASFALTVSAAAAVRDFELLSINSAGTASGAGASVNPVVSSNGQYVAFVSEAANLVANDGNGTRDVFWRDRVAGTTRLVSHTPAGASGTGESDSPVISADGRYVAFHSRADDLVTGDTNGRYDVFVWDAHDNSVTLVSRTPAGVGGAGHSFSPRISANGRVVSFASDAPDLAGTDTNRTLDAFARDLDAGVTYLVSTTTGGAAGNGSCAVPVISANGRYVAFASIANNLVANDTNGVDDIFVHDLQTRVTTLVSVNAAGTGSGDRFSFEPAISADGRYVAFASQATNLVATLDTNSSADVFVRDMQMGVTKLVSVNGSGTATGGNAGISSLRAESVSPVLSVDGTKVLFVSFAQDLVGNDSNAKPDVFLRDHINNTTTLISTNRFGTGSGNAASGMGAYSLSADMRYVAFFSEASNLGAADTNSRTDVFLRDLATNSTKIISRVNAGGFAANGHSFQPVISADGSTILFTSEAGNLDNRDANTVSDVFAASTTLGAPNFGVVDAAVSITSVGAQTVGTPFTLTITVTNNSATPATGLVIGNSKPEFLRFDSATVSQGTMGSGGWVVGDLAANGSATSVATLVATNLGSGNLIVSIIRRDQLDSNLNNNSALSTITADRTAAGALFYLAGNTPYLSRTNSPFFAGILSGAFTLEDFESGAFSLAGVTASAGRVIGPGGQTDSVDADDGVVDGNGNGGRSYLVNETNSVTFSFNALVLGRLPTKVGIVLTDGYPTGSGIEAFDSNGISLGFIGPFEIGDNLFTGETAEDRFLGVEFAGGISALRVIYLQADFELDHLQFDIPTTDLQLTGTAPATALVGANFTVTLAVTNRGPGAVTSAVVTNADPGPIQLVSAVASQGAFDPQTGTWNIGALPVGAGALLTLTIAPTNSGQVQFFSRVLSEVPDRNTTNDTVTRTVLVPNQPPVVTFPSNNVIVLEDAGVQTLAGFVSISFPEPGQTITNSVTTISNSALFSVLPQFQPGGTLTFTPATNANGIALVTLVVQDNGGTANGGVDRTTNTFTITVTAVNDGPTVTLATNLLVVLEHAGPQSFPGFVTASAGAGLNITNYTVTYTAPGGIFAAEPAVALDGTFTFTAAVTANGSATLNVIAQNDGGTANGGVDRTTNTFTLTVVPVNDAPSFVFGVPRRFGNATPITIPDVSPAVPYPSTINVSALTATVTNVSVTLFGLSHSFLADASFLLVGPQGQKCMLMRGVGAYAGQGGVTQITVTLDPSPANPIMSDLTLMSGHTYRPTMLDGADNNMASPAPAGPYVADLSVFNGVDPNGVWSLYVVDEVLGDVGTIAGGWSLAFNNEVPQLTVLEDSGPYVGTGFVTNVLAGPTDELTQSVSFTVTNSNPALFSVQPAMANTGTLNFTPAANAYGSAVVTVIAQDDGGTVGGGVDQATNTFTITVTSINDAPVISFSTNTLFVAEDSGPNTFIAFATFNTVESGQAFTNITATNSNPAIFSVQPYFTVDGTLRFTPAPDSTGTGVVTVIVQDNGGTANAGVDLATNTFTLIVSPVNIAPSFTMTNFPATDGVQDWVRDVTANTSSGVKVVTDAQGNVIVAGDELLPSEGTLYQVVVVKYSSDGVALWTTAIPGVGADSVQLKGLALDSAGAVIVVADYAGATHDFLTVKYDADAALVWSNRFDALGDDVPMAVAVDANDKVIVTGSSRTNGYTDYLTIKYLPDGTLVWTNRSSYAGPGNDVPRSVAVDAAGDVYVTGDGSNTDYTYAYTLKLAAATGVPVWTNQFDFAGENSTAEAVRVDGGGNVIVAGTLNGPGFQPYFGVVKYSSAGAMIWTNLYARNIEFQHVHGLAVDSDGNAIITGNTEVSGDMDFTTIKYLADGTPAWTNHYNGLLSGRDHPNAIAVNTAREVFVTGESVGSNGSDFLTVKYSAAGAGVWTNRYNGSSNGEDFAYALATDSATNVFVTGAADGVMRTIKYAFTPASGANQTMSNTVGAVSFPGFIVSSSVGPANESAQSLSFAVTNDNSGLFSVQPAISAAGVLTYTVNSGVSGLAVVTVRAQDTGGTDNGGVDTSVPQSFNITVLSGSSARLYYWLGGIGDWNDPAAWTPRGVPGVTDSASIASGTVQLTNSVAVAHLTLDDGILGGAGSLAIRSSMNWNGGVMSGAGATTIAIGATMAISGAAEKNLNRRLDNYGAVTWTDSRITGDSAPIINNYAGATFHIQTDATLFESYSGGARTFNNAGTLLKSVATGTSAIHGIFNQAGTVDTRTGTINPTETNNLGNASFSGAGRFLVSGGTLTLNGSVTVASGANFEFNGGSLTGTGTILGTMKWTGGTMDGAGTTTIAINSVLALSGAGEKSLNRRLENYGTITWAGARITGDNSPVLDNKPGALLDIQTDAALYESYTGVGPRTLNNAGTVRKSAGTGVSILHGTFNNISEINVQTGSLGLTEAVNLNDTSLTGAGRFHVASGVLTLNGTVTVAGGTIFEFGGGSLVGSGTIVGTMKWTGGTMEGVGTTTVATNGVLLISDNEKYLNRRLDNYGTVTWTGARIIGDNGPVINNYAGALFDAQTDAALFESNDMTVKTFNNAGTVRKSVATGTSTWQGLFSNVGTLHVQTGTLSLAGGGASSGAFTNAVGGILEFTGGTQVLNSGASFSGAGTNRINGATVNVSPGVTVAVTGNFALASGTLGGAGSFFVSDGSQMAWTGGVMASGGQTTIATNGVLLISGNEKYLNRRLDNYGTVTWTGARIIGDNGPVINNYAGALFDTRTDAALFESNDMTVKTFNNAGTVRKSVATGTSTWQGVFNNSGLVEVQTGILSLPGGGTLAGAFTSSLGALLDFTGGTQMLNSGASFSGAGLIRISSGSVLVSANVALAAPSRFEFAGGTLGGAGTFTIPAGSQVIWTGGTMEGTGATTVATNGVLLISGGQKFLNRRLDNYGTVTWTGARIIGDNGPTINNYAGALFDAQTDATLFESNDMTVKTFNNAGTVRKSVATGSSPWLGLFNNVGTLHVQTGTLSLLGGGASSGAFTNAVGGTLDFTGGTQELNSGASFSGAGLSRISGATVNIGAGATMSVTGNFELATGTLGGTGTFSVSAGSQMAWTGGMMEAGGTTTVSTNGVLLITGGQKFLNRRLDNYGTVTWTGARIIGDNGPVINNYAGALFDSQTGASLFDSNDALVKTFNNAGTVRKSAGTGTQIFSGTFNNTGLLELRTGTLTLAGDYAPGASSTLRIFLGGPTAGTQFGQLQVNGTATLNGALDIVLTNSFVPVPANTFAVVVTGTRSGTFSSVTGDSLGGGLSLDATYLPTGVTLVAVMVAGSPPLSPQAVGSERLLRWPGSSVGYELQTTTALGPNAEWTPVRAPVELEGGDSIVRLPEAGGIRFYRLVRTAAPRPGPNPTQ